MDAQDEIFQAIESYKDMTIEALQYSKIGKGECLCLSVSSAYGVAETEILERRRDTAANGIHSRVTKPSRR
jgi:hypothetical protein